MNVAFKIDKEGVYNEVAKTTAYIGAKNDVFEKVATEKENEELLESFIESACNDIVNLLAAYKAKIEGGDFELSIPEAQEDKMQIIERLVFDYMVCSVIWRWLYITMPEKAEMWAAKTEDLRIKIRTIVAVGGINKVKRKCKPF